jgi:hypothetical protein
MIRGFRKLSVLAFILFSEACLFGAIDVIAINGVWLDKDSYNWMANGPESRQEKGLILVNINWSFWWDKQKQTGFFRNGIWLDTLKSIKKFPDGRISMKIVHPFSDGEFLEYEIVIRIISYNTLEVISHPFPNKHDFLTRVFDSSKTEIARGTVNNERVRLRNNPDLKSGVWFYLNSGESIGIFGRTRRKERIGELEDYWYEVYVGDGELGDFEKNVSLFWSGWVFGAYLDIENRAALDADLDQTR